MSKTLTPEDAARMLAERQARRAVAPPPAPSPSVDAVPSPLPPPASEPPAPPASGVADHEPDRVETSPEAASPEGLPPAIGSKIESVLAQLRRRRDGQEKPIQTPWSDLNEQLGGGWWPGVHVLISGTGAGKSQLVIEAGTDAAAEGRAVIGYAALELDDVGILSRVAARLAMRDNRALSWSAVSRGEVNPDDDVMVRAFQRMSNLPFHLDTGSTVGWSVSNLETMARSLREANPGKPLLLVVDFLQLVAGDRDSREDARSRIGRVAYQARGLARDLQAAIVLVSSTARQNYNLFANDSGFPPAGLRLDGTRRSILSPDMLVGLGKETGEIEYAADSVTVMGRIPRDRFPSGPDGFGPVLLATAKLRAGPPSWCVLGSNGQTFRPWSAEENQAVLDALAPPDKTKRKTGEAKPKATATTNDDDDDYVIPPCLQG